MFVHMYQRIRFFFNNCKTLSYSLSYPGQTVTNSPIMQCFLVILSCRSDKDNMLVSLLDSTVSEGKCLFLLLTDEPLVQLLIRFRSAMILHFSACLLLSNVGGPALCKCLFRLVFLFDSFIQITIAFPLLKPLFKKP